jgi:hypothetical protein
MIMGPLMVAAGAASLFYLVAVSWLHFHIAKQHFGFVMLYKHKGRERDRVDFVLDRWFLLVSLMLPYFRFALHSFYPYLAATTFMRIAESGALAAYVVLAGVYLLRQLHLWRINRPLNRPKLMLMSAVVPLQWAAFAYAGTTADGLVRAGIILGLFHSFQYHRLLWFHNKNRYGTPEAESASGLAAILARKFGYYFGAAVVLHLLISILPGKLVPSPYVSAALWGIPFTHYILDSVIWRVRGNKELAAVLQLN